MAGTKGWRGALSLCACAIAILAACNGFPRPAPISEAENRPESYPTYQASPPIQLIAVDSQRWMVLPGATTEIAARLLQPEAGSGLLGLRWSQAPFSTLYHQAGNGRLHEAGEIR